MQQVIGKIVSWQMEAVELRFFPCGGYTSGNGTGFGIFAWSKRRQEEIWDSFRRLIDAARREKPEIFDCRGFVSPSAALKD